MNKTRIVQFIIFCCLWINLPAMASFTLNGTRFIYDEERKNIAVEVRNNSKSLYGGQVWIDNTNQPAKEVYFIPTPTFFKVGGEKKQLIRIMKINNSLPTNQESLFWLNVQEIPPAPKADENNVLALALNTQVKLIYRPKLLSKQREDAETQLVMSGNILKNPTPYYFAVTAVLSGDKSVALSNAVMKNLAEFAPFSEIDLGKSIKGDLSVEAIDDYGARRIHKIK